MVAHEAIPAYTHAHSQEGEDGVGFPPSDLFTRTKFSGVWSRGNAEHRRKDASQCEKEGAPQ